MYLVCFLMYIWIMNYKIIYYLNWICISKIIIYVKKIKYRIEVKIYIDVKCMVIIILEVKLKFNFKINLR